MTDARYIAVRASAVGVAAALAVAGAVPAQACVGPGLKTYVLRDAAPKSPPRGVVSMRVRVARQAVEIAESAGVPVEADLLDAAGHAVSHVRIDPGQWSSCSRWGPLDVEAYATGFMMRRPDGETVLSAAQIEPLHDTRKYRIDPAVRAKKRHD